MKNKKRKRPQKSKTKGKYNPFPVNDMSDGLFDYGHRDGGYDNWIPVKDRDYYETDRSEWANKSNMSALLPKQGQRKKENRYT